MNINGAYENASGLLKKFFGVKLSISASETISSKSSELYEDYYDLKTSLSKLESKEDYVVVSFDGKGVSMIKTEAAKIVARKGKGEKKQKKKEQMGSSLLLTLAIRNGGLRNGRNGGREMGDAKWGTLLHYECYARYSPIISGLSRIFLPLSRQSLTPLPLILKLRATSIPPITQFIHSQITYHSPRLAEATLPAFKRNGGRCYISGMGDAAEWGTRGNGGREWGTLLHYEVMQDKRSHFNFLGVC